MRAPSLLFSAPSRFSTNIRREFEGVVESTFTEIWTADDLSGASDVDYWVLNPGQSFVVDSGVLERFPRLRLIVTPSTGTNHIDLEACEARDIQVRCLLDDRAGLERISASAEFTFLLMLNTLRRLDLGAAEVRAGRWRQREDQLRGRELSGKRVGLVGMGRIGRRLARYCRAFEADVSYHDPYVPEIGDTQSIDLERVFSSSDIVCVCCGLTDQTVGLITADLMRLLKPGASLVNTSRGEILAQSDLVEVLKEREDLKVGLDVLAGEVSGEHLASELLAMHSSGRIVITPHIAGATIESQEKAARIALALVERYIEDSEKPSPVGDRR